MKAIEAHLNELKNRFPIIGDVRGLGLLYGFEFVADRESKAPFDPSLNIASRFVRKALELGLVGYACTGSVDGAAGDMNLVAPPLTITREQVDEMIGLFKSALDATTRWIREH